MDQDTEPEIDSEYAYSLGIKDISTEELIPRDIIFESDATESPEKMSLKSKFAMPTNEDFYSDGIIGNIFLDQQINDESEIAEAPNKKLLFENFGNHNWLVGFSFFLQYFRNMNGILLENENIKILNVGNHNNGFIAGIHYYLFYSTANTQHTIFDVDWLGVDIKNNNKHKCYKKLDAYLKKNQRRIFDHIIHGLVDDDISQHKNFVYIQSIIANRFGLVHMLCNNIKPKKNRKNILILFAILVMQTLHQDGCFLTKILEPEHWGFGFQNYLLLFSLIFHTSHIFRFPICRHKKIYFRYYFVGFCKKEVLYRDIIHKKLMNAYCSNKIQFSENIWQMESIAQWRTRLMQIKSEYINQSTNSQEMLYKIIGGVGDHM
jgi:hypothetical protein